LEVQDLRLQVFNRQQGSRPQPHDEAVPNLLLVVVVVVVVVVRSSGQVG